MSRRALITGGAGFIGSHLAGALLERGWRVHVIDDLSTGRVRNIAAFHDRPHFRATFNSVLRADVMEPLVADTDVVFHLAAAVGVRLIVERPVHTIATNIKSTEVVLELAAKHRRAVLLSSTSEVYGKLDRAKFAESDDLVLGATSKSRWCYAASKIIDEHLALAYAREFGLPVTVLRMFNTIGPRQTGQYGMVVPRFVHQALAGEPLTVYGDGRQRRSFTWVGDVVDAMVALIAHPGASGEVFNVGHTAEITIYDLARMVKDMVGSRSDIVLVPFERAYEPGFEDMQRRLPDISKLERLIGYQPSLNLGAMLERIIADHRVMLDLAARHAASARDQTAHARPAPAAEQARVAGG